MFEAQAEELRHKVKRLAAEALRCAEPSSWFEVLYVEAENDPVQVPWARLSVHPALQVWLERYASSQYASSINSRTALAIGCGLGDDAEALAQWGLKVTAFDIAPTAIAWCQRRFPNSSVNYVVADLFAPDPNWKEAFDLVLESRNLQALPVNVRASAIASVAQCVAPGGTLLIVTRTRSSHDNDPDGPPWPLSDRELDQFQTLGLQEIRRGVFDEGDAIEKFWIEYRAKDKRQRAEGRGQRVKDRRQRAEGRGQRAEGRI